MNVSATLQLEACTMMTLRDWLLVVKDTLSLSLATSKTHISGQRETGDRMKNELIMYGISGGHRHIIMHWQCGEL